MRAGGDARAGLEPPFETTKARKVQVYTFTQYKGSFPFPQVYPPQVRSPGLEWLLHFHSLSAWDRVRSCMIKTDMVR